ncbi:thermonuclease family protein [Enterococcus faecalis]|nr:thermonuclease family protein [Enterococcus faecalis]
MKKNSKRWIIVIVIALSIGIKGIDGVREITDDRVSSTSKIGGNEDRIDKIPKLKKIPVKLIRKVDGDTAVFSMENPRDGELKVRYLLIDTPETVKPNAKIQPFGKEASNRNEQILKNANQIYLMLDKGARTDRYGRVLAYVFADDILVQEKLVSEGLAEVKYIKPPSTKYLSKLKRAQNKAEKKCIGIWK